MNSIYDLMASATKSLDMTMYEFSDTHAEAILEADTKRGVVVRVLLDKDFSGESENAAAFNELRSSGVNVHWAVGNTIFHQKTITVDNTTSVVMTANLTAQYYPTSRDLAVFNTNLSDVAAIEATFNADWPGTSDPKPGPPGADLVWSPGSEQDLLSLINSAQHSLEVENEEMSSEPIIQALSEAARRGVEVEVVMTYQSEWASAFDKLTAAGVHVATYSPSAPLYIHAKVIEADGSAVFVGSQNFSTASMNYNRELGLETAYAPIVHGIAATVSHDFAGGTSWTK